jgi:serine/threonine protein phosphatase PrpC
VLLGHPGWVLVCSDGLWNYCSDAGQLGDLVTSLSGTTASPLELGEALVRWANEQGGRDNVSVALARH